MKHTRSWLMVTIVALVLALSTQVACLATTYYVSTTGSDSNSGLSTAQAWATIDNGDKSLILQPGDTVIVLSGTYNIDTVLLSKCSGTIFAPIVYEAQAGVVLDRGLVDAVGISIEGSASYVVLNGFHIKGGTEAIKIAGTTGNEIKNCLMTNLYGQGAVMNVGQTTNVSVHNNVIDLTMATAPINAGVWAHNSNGGDKYYNNTIVNASQWGFESVTGNAPVEFTNNIIYAGTVTGGIYSDNTQFVHSYNILYGNFTYPYGGYAGGQGSNNLEVNPLFVDTAGGDYHLQAGSPAIDSGVFVGLSYQGSAPDRGAFESAGTPVMNTGSVVGRVTEAGSGLFLAGATVKLLDSLDAVVAQTTTDSNGHYKIAGKTGTWTVAASFRGYADAVSSATITADAITEANFALTAAPSQTYYVSPTGNDGDTGLSEAHAWATIDNGDINNKLSPGDKVIVLPGTYDVSLNDPAGVFISKCGGTLARPIKYIAQGDVTIAHGIDYPFPALYIGDQAKYIVFDGFKVTGGRPTLWVNNTTGNEIKNSRFSDMTAEDNRACVYVTGASNNVFHNNVVAPSQPSNATWGISSEASAGGDKFYNNTIVGANGWAFLTRAGNEPVEFKNNIIYTGTATGGIYSENAQFVHSNNIVFGTFTYPYGGYAAGQGSDNLEVDPLFVNAAGGDYNLQAGSPAIDSGLFVGLSYQGSAPDRGAFETTGSPVMGVGSVAGRVVGGGIALAGATVKLLDSLDAIVAQTTTDSNGYYKIAWYAGTWTVKASLNGYSDASSSVTIVADDSTVVDIVLTALGPVPPQTYYVSPTGNDSNTGLSMSQAWATIDKGDRDNVLNAGDTVIVLPGTYNVPTGGVGLNKCAGTATKPIKYEAQGVVTIARGANSGSAVYIGAPAQYIVLDGFRITGGVPNLFVENSTGNEVKNCKFSELYPWDHYPCVLVSGSGNNIIHHNVVEPKQPSASRGIQDMSSTGGDKFYNNTIVGATEWGFLSLSGNVSTEFRNNIIYAGAATGGIYSENALFVHSNNIVYGSFSYPYGGYAGGQGADNLEVDPLFVNAAGGDYRLQAISQAINTGSNVGLSYLGSAPDRGAFEFDPTAVDVGSISDIKSAANGQRVRLTSAMAVTVPSTAFADGSIYIEDPDRSSGVLVLGALGLSAGDRITLTGTVGTNANGEKYLQVISIDNVTSGSSLGPLGMNNKSEPAALVTGLLVKIWGKVTSVQGSSYCYVDDGSNIDDGTGHVGVRVILDALAAPLSTLPAADDRIAVTGVAGLVADGASVPAIRIRSGLDIAPY
ncbi:MAG: carboxypeptidase regulatory-like domain-containing protein [Armatimonadota bacterium]